MSVLDDVRLYLIDGGVTFPIYLGAMPEGPDRAVALYETGGLPPIHGMHAGPGGPLVERPRVQVVARAEQGGYAAARAEVERAKDLLDWMPDGTVNGTRYLHGEAVQEPFGFGVDANNRPRVACNFQLVKEP